MPTGSASTRRTAVMARPRSERSVVHATPALRATGTSATSIGAALSGSTCSAVAGIVRVKSSARPCFGLAGAATADGAGSDGVATGLGAAAAAGSELTFGVGTGGELTATCGGEPTVTGDTTGVPPFGVGDRTGERIPGASAKVDVDGAPLLNILDFSFAAPPGGTSADSSPISSVGLTAACFFLPSPNRLAIESGGRELGRVEDAVVSYAARVLEVRTELVTLP